MTLTSCWLIFPVVLALLSLGCGLLLEATAGRRLPGALLPAAGLAVMIVVADFATSSDATAELAAPAVIACAAAGIGLALPWERGRLDGWALASAAGVFAVFAAPVVLSGEATFTGYIKLDDTATWLALTDRLLEHGRSLAGLAPSSYEAVLDVNLGRGYPVGGFPPLGIGAELVGEDPAWVFQPYLAVLAAMLALSLYVLTEPLISSGPLRALAAFVASQPALLFGYALWGGVKELVAAWLLALLGALIGPVLRAGAGVRALIPLAIASAALVSALSFGGAIWLVPLLVPLLVLLVRLRGRVLALRHAVAYTALAAAFSIPSLLTADDWLRPASGTLTSETDLGNLIEPLSLLQLFGIWPTGDFRLDPDRLDAAYVLIAVVALMGAIGVAWAWSRRAWALLAYLVAAVAGGLAIAALASPWVGAKALATASPALLLAGAVGAAALFQQGRRVEAAIATGAIVGGVLWSNALAYQEVTLAPRDRLAELEEVGERIADQGPTLMIDYEPYGVRHFLRDADPEGASELRRRPVPLWTGRSLDKIEFADIDEFRLDGILTYRTLVLRRSPVASRPPSVYRLVSSDRYYEVWQRPQTLPRLVERVPLGNRQDPTGVPRCADVLRLARRAGPGGRLATVRRRASTVLDLSRAARPVTWQPSGQPPGVVSPVSAGTLMASVAVPAPARYDVWLGGSFRRELEVSIGGTLVGDERHNLSHSGQYIPLGSVRLPRGLHQVAIRYGAQNLRPGSGGPPFPLGPLVLSRGSTDGPVTFVSPAEAPSLCGKRLDWVEALGS